MLRPKLFAARTEPSLCMLTRSPNVNAEWALIFCMTHMAKQESGRRGTQEGVTPSVRCLPHDSIKIGAVDKPEANDQDSVRFQKTLKNLI
jgi:hypothetical protein